MAERELLLGCDIGSSSVKTTLLDAATGKAVAAGSSPHEEMPISSPQKGRAEQDPGMWWENLVAAVQEAMRQADASPKEVRAIGIAYQMHGLVLVDKKQNVLRPAIIWCDSRAASVGDTAFHEIGEAYCLEHYLNSPGNFTASRLKWVMEHEPETFKKADSMLLPGDYIAMRMTGETATTLTGLSEGVLWDFREKQPADLLLSYYGIPEKLLATAHPSFDLHGKLTGKAAKELGLKKRTPVTYKAGDQPNNAFSLNVLNPGEAAATAGTSGVIYAVTDRPAFDPKSRVNTFMHVNNREQSPRNGVLLCVNGTGILNSWLKKILTNESAFDYNDMNRLAMVAVPGSGGLTILPFGNGAERILENREIGAQLLDLDLNRHGRADLCRAVQEGIVFALRYGFDIMRDMGIEPKWVRAGRANMFQSPLFRELFADNTGAVLELYRTDGSEGAARGAGIGAGIFRDEQDAFIGLEKLEVIEPDKERVKVYDELYQNWLTGLSRFLP
ncbi:xylulokinase [Rhodohalobacter mucosus]|uniref:Carbohydrate kinase n=1 Tax=Rhodohalobacter mucosus TaxID=2079485 RepID=A0A316TVT9_9BACT|nr:FGGY family carbohydrate kinase [Rhodohalobacter mucosus]PWN07275.1 carbohydrate kinase [Rhodohalobacter mucosus]